MKAPQTSGTVPEVFISHSEEALAIAIGESVRRVSGNRIKTFISSRDIGGEEDFRSAIQAAVHRSCAFVCLVTRESQSRPWVNYEIGFAHAMAKPVLMVLLEGRASEYAAHPVGNRQFIRCTRDGIFGLLKQLHAYAQVDFEAGAEKFAKQLVETWVDILRNEAAVQGDHLSKIKRLLDDRSYAACEELRTASSSLEDEYLQWFTDSLKALPYDAALLAICGDKSWNHTPVFEYLRLNTDVCEEKRVHVHRVYLEPSRGFSPVENALIERHTEWAEDCGVHFEISVVFGDRAQSLRSEFGLPEGFGLVIPVGAAPLAMMHYGLGNNQRLARAFRNPLIVDIYKWIHGRLASHHATLEELKSYLAKATTKKDRAMVSKFIPPPPAKRK